MADYTESPEYLISEAQLQSTLHDARAWRELCEAYDAPPETPGAELVTRIIATPQRQVAAHVTARGYRAGLTTDQFASRQIAKLAEELGELAANCEGLPSRFWAMLADAAAQGRHVFQDFARWNVAELDHVYGFEDSQSASAELDDLQVVLFNLADALGHDVIAGALAKSAADVARGTR